MGRPRTQGAKSSKLTLKWGVSKPFDSKRKRSDGTEYSVWRCSYYIYDFFLQPGEELWEVRRLRRYAQGDTDIEARKKAEQMTSLNERYCDETFPPGSEMQTFSDWLNTIVSNQSDLGIAQQEIRSKVENVQKSKTFELVAREYMESRTKYSVEGHPIDLKAQYLRTVENYIRHAAPLSELPMDSLRLPDITSWFKDYQMSHKQGTAGRLRAWLVPVGRYAERSEYWRKNLFESLPKLSTKTKKEEKRVWSLDEIDSMFGAATTIQQEAMLILLRLGLRQGEITGLTGDDLINENTIRIKYSLNLVNVGTHTNGHWIPYLDRPKTDASAADKVRVSTVWMQVLKKSLEFSKEIQFELGMMTEAKSKGYIDS
jgi:hypothetical protein